MFERFTERARQTVVLAQEEARNLNHPYIGTEHILLGLIREKGGLAARVLEKLDVNYDEVYEYASRLPSEDEAIPAPGQQLPFTPRAKKIYELALRESLSLGHNYIGTEHILLGLARDDHVASNILYNEVYHFNAEAIRDEVIKQLQGPSGRSTRKEQQEARGRERWQNEQRRKEEESSSEMEVRSVRGQVITISGDLTLEIDRDIYGRLSIQIKNPSGLPLTISEK
jgi:ATP-dependent Clp protease ATP-binding subunit ClpC